MRVLERRRRRCVAPSSGVCVVAPAARAINESEKWQCEEESSMPTCPGCACLCEDIEIAGAEIRNVCRKGFGIFRSRQKSRLSAMVADGVTDVDAAIEKAAEILCEARSPVIYGLDNSTCEAQKLGLELARKLNAFVDDTSSVCQGVVLEAIYKGRLPSCTLDAVRDNADLVIFWGADPASSHPRHLSKYSFFPRGKKIQRGYEERKAFCIDVRHSPTAEVCKNLVKIPVGADTALINALTSIIEGKTPQLPEVDRRAVFELAAAMRRAEFVTIFTGLGLVYSLEDVSLLESLLRTLTERHGCEAYVIPMVGHFNMRGMTQLLFEETSLPNKVKFEGGVARGGASMTDILHEGLADAALIIGSDPLSSLPFVAARRLLEMKTITIDPHVTPTTEISTVRIPCAISGVECGGHAVRMDGVEVTLEKAFDTEFLSDEEILKRLLDRV